MLEGMLDEPQTLTEPSPKLLPSMLSKGFGPRCTSLLTTDGTCAGWGSCVNFFPPADDKNAESLSKLHRKRSALGQYTIENCE